MACGGHAQESGPGQDWTTAGETNGGANGEARAGAPPLAFGGGPPIIVPSAGGTTGQPPNVPEGTNCQFSAPTCSEREQQIWINPATSDATLLAYPLDTSCGQCVMECRSEDCPVEYTCSLRASGRESCGSLSLSVAACSGLDGNGACLNTATSQPYYIDATGKRWNQVTLLGDATQLSLPLDGLLDLDLDLEIGDGVTTRTLRAHARVCAHVVQTLQVCK